jgi:hypothetical protein
MQMSWIHSFLILISNDHLNIDRFLTAYDQQAGGSNKAENLIKFLTNFHPTLIKRLIVSIKSRYDKIGHNAEMEKVVYKEKEKNYRDNIAVLEEKI